MKKIFIIASIVLLFTSCNEWLNIPPKSEIASNVLFESEQGFKDALVGSYLLMTSPKTYGFESTIGFVDALAQQYYMPGTTHPYYLASTYQYGAQAVVTKKDDIWAVNYNGISNLNNIIENIDAKKATLNPANYAFIKGESLGLRAFLHFDLFRLFGYGNLIKDPGSLSKQTLPYVTKYTKHITAQVSVSAYIDSLKNDLNKAAELLAPYDSVSVGVNKLPIPNTDLFYNNRQMRFNYYAVKATQARLYLWIGDYDNAILAAKEVVAKASRHQVAFHSGNINDPNPVNKDYTFSTEHIFSLGVPNLYDVVRPFIQRFAADGININYSRLNQNGVVADNLYEIASKPQMSQSDYRYKELYNKVSSSDYLLMKFNYVDGSTFKDRMPIIKLPEMYYILAEAYNEKGDQTTAVGYLNTVRRNRAIQSTYDLSPSLTKDGVDVEIEKEYRKEFVSEGQLFYYYKRLGKTVITGTSRVMDNSIYVLPMPERELEMGAR
ncbi:RagB/SusD family nutrient uptake outer membrane protein [Solitalea koreensis]|uniref:Starch-binding associating with outer membrane n=1 Tax=Solitalea koreensis TaxID=543615 RepID=A0A521AG21_9SPHI|nr:RagB/SusD family nutrient uptake outer membrane protein [Solitalea koreensis]SMO33660.1 Starch-binding associating with outer membrane [Solitalea koreensis]